MVVGTGNGNSDASIGPQERTGTQGGMSGARVSRPQHPNRVLAGLPQSDFAAVARHLQVLTLAPGKVLHKQNDPVHSLYFPHNGLVSLLTMTLEGETVEAASVGRCGVICALHPSEFQNAFFTAQSLGPMGISRIAAARLQLADLESRALEDALDRSRKMIFLQWRQNLVCQARHNAEQRLARWLLETADHMELSTVHATQEEVAQRLALRRTTVTLAAHKLQDAGAIHWGRSHAVIVDRVSLGRAACSCYGVLRNELAASDQAPADLHG